MNTVALATGLSCNLHWQVLCLQLTGPFRPLTQLYMSVSLDAYRISRHCSHIDIILKHALTTLTCLMTKVTPIKTWYKPGFYDIYKLNDNTNFDKKKQNLIGENIKGSCAKFLFQRLHVAFYIHTHLRLLSVWDQFWLEVKIYGSDRNRKVKKTYTSRDIFL